MREYPIVLKFSIIAYPQTTYTFIKNEQKYTEWCTANGNSCWIDSFREIPYTHFYDAYDRIEKPIIEIYEYISNNMRILTPGIDAFLEFVHDHSGSKDRVIFKFNSTDIHLFCKPSAKVKDICHHPKRYKNTVSKTLIFWVCSDCKSDLGDA